MTQTQYVAPAILAAGYTVQASDWNTSVYNDVTYLYDPPMAKYHATADQGIASATWSARTFQAADWDTDGIGPGLNTSGIFTIQTAGIYHCLGTWRFSPASGGTLRSGRLNVNSGTLIAYQDVPFTSGTQTANGVVSARQLFNVGDTLILELYQDSGASLANTGSVTPLGYSLSVRWEGPGS